MKRLIKVLPGLFLPFAVFVGTALAHANLVRSNPEGNAVLERQPARIELLFTEPLEPAFSEIKVFDSSGAQVDVGDSKVDPAGPTRLTVSLRTVPDGVYTVSWRVLSTVDGHITSGAYPFAVGDVDAAALAAAAEASQRIKLSFGEVAARWLQYLGAAALAGGMLFGLLVWEPALRETPVESDPAKDYRQQLLQLGLAVFLFANILFLLFQAGQALGGEIAAPWDTAVGNVLFNTRSGALWLARVSLALAFAAVLPRAISSSKTQWLAFGLAAAMLLVISVGSHAAAEPRPVLPVLADWLHLLGASVWTGGLFYFVVGLRKTRQLPESERTRLTAQLIPRFTRIALPSVAILAASSLYALYLRVGSLDALVNTFYGNTILGKIALFLPLLILGAINFLAITPRMRAAAQTPLGDMGLVQRFRRIVTAEITLAALVMLIVGLLTALPPARDAENPAGLTEQERVDDLRIALEIAPGQIGLNTYSVRLTSDGQPLSDAREVLLRFTPTTVDLPQSEVTLPPQGDGLYSLKGANLGLPDEWQVQVVVRRENQFDAFANFYFPVGVAATQTFPWYRVAAVLLLAAGLALFFALRAHLKPSRKTRVFAPALALGVILAGAFVFYDPPGDIQVRLPVNPVAPNEASLAAGEALYQQNCQNCHGATGRGDGPVGVTLNPRPADLSIHTEPGVHPDGQLFMWISEGFPGSAMPAFENLLGEEEQWHLVNYIRTFSRE